MITEKILLSRGYKKYPTDTFHKSADFLMQRFICDGVGKKYAINIYCYTFNRCLNKKDAWEIEMQSTNPFITMGIYDAVNIDKAEDMIELFWRTFECEYYERY